MEGTEGAKTNEQRGSASTTTKLDNSRDAPAHRTAQKRRRKWPWILAALLLIVVIAVLFHRGQSNEPSARGKTAGGPPPVVIGTANARQGDIGVYVSALGVVTPVNTVAVRSRVDGQLVKVHYVEGPNGSRGRRWWN